MTRLWYSVFASLLPALVAAQDAASICLWQQPRAAVIRDSIYFDGGLWGTAPIPDFCDPQGRAQTKLSFSQPFNSSTNFTALLPFNDTVPKDRLYPYHLDGFMVADNDELYTFGGMAQPDKPITTNTGVSGFAWESLYVSNGAVSDAQLGTTNNYKPAGNFTHKYITNGGGVNVPSEQLSFYLGGLSSQDNVTFLNYPGITQLNNSDFPSALVNSMLMVNTSNPGKSNWTEIPLPSGIARAEATLAFVPIGKSGAIVVMGGTLYPSDIFGDQGKSCALSANYVRLNSQADSFMTNISIYDIYNGRWFSQTTNGDVPKQLSQACAVVASAPDNSTHHVYMYGGYGYPNGVNKTSVASDDVWILSLPAFTWFRVESDNTNHGRTGQVCAKPYPDQMMIIGGATACRGALGSPDTSFADVFNLTSLQWTNGTYDPAVWSNYVVPSRVKSSIPRATPSDINQDLVNVFKTTYPGKQAQYYPYPKIQNGIPLPPSPPQPGPAEPTKRAAWVLPVAITIPVVAFLALLGLAIFCCMRRRNSKETFSSSGKTRVNSWLSGARGEKSVMSSDDTHLGSPDVHEVNGENYFKDGGRSRVSELHSPLNSPIRGGLTNSQTAELHAHSIPAELPTETREGSSTASPYFRSHPLYPPNISGVASTTEARSISSPDTGPITPYELAQNRSKDKVLAPIPNDMFLDQVQPRSPKIVAASTKPQPSHVASTADTGDVSPELRPVSDDSFPNDPPQRSFGAVTTPPQRPYHHRHTSSMSSEFSNVSNDGHNDDHRRSEYHRSMTISPIPNSPNTIRTAASPTPQSPEMDTSGLNQAQTHLTTNVKRKEVNAINRKQVGSGSTPAAPTDE